MKIFFLMRFYVLHHLEQKNLDVINTFFPNKPKIKYIDDLYYKSGKNLFDILMLNAEKKMFSGFT